MFKNMLMLSVLVLYMCAAVGCVSEAVNKSIGEMLNDPTALETPQDPDEPIFNPETEKLIEHSPQEDIQDRFQNVR